MNTFLFSAIFFISIPCLAEKFNPDTDWFSQSKYGLIIHFLADFYHDDMTVTQWNKLVDEFDVEKLADDVANIKAGYVILTLGQNSGFYCAPNTTYTNITGSNKLSHRDLPMDLSKALAEKGIKMILYLPSAAPNREPKLMRENLGMEFGSHVKDIHGLATETFKKNWSKIIEEWSLRYKNHVSGWWFDGAWDSKRSFAVFPDHAYFKAFAQAAKSGNDKSIVTFNPSDDFGVIRHTEYEDYTAGERRDLDVLPEDRWLDGSQWHFMTYMGDTWAASNTRHEDIVWIDFITKTNAVGGVVTIDVHVNTDPSKGTVGRIPDEQMRQLRKISSHINGHSLNENTLKVLLGNDFVTASKSHIVLSAQIDIDLTSINQKCRWLLREGPGEVYYSDQSSPQCTIKVDKLGLYKFMFQCESGKLIGYDQISVMVKSRQDPTSQVYQAEKADQASFLRTLMLKDPNKWITYEKMDFGSVPQQLTIKASKDGEPGLIEIRLDSTDGKLLGELTIDTNSWNDYEEYNIPLKGIKGVHNICLAGRSFGAAQVLSLSIKGDKEQIRLAIHFDDMDPYLFNKDYGNITLRKGWIQFSNIDFGTGCSLIDLNVATGVDYSTLEIRLDAPDGSLVANVEVPMTDYRLFTIVPVNIPKVVGKHNLYIVGTSDFSGVLDWLEVYPDNSRE